VDRLRALNRADLPDRAAALVGILAFALGLVVVVGPRVDIGATLCRPRDPRCDACPLRDWMTMPVPQPPLPSCVTTLSVIAQLLQFVNSNV